MSRIKTRDYSMLQIIMGATKAGVHRDNRAAANKQGCKGQTKMYAARKPLKFDTKIEWTRPAEHGGVEVFDVYGCKLNPADGAGSWHIARIDIIDEDGEPVFFNALSLSDEECLAIENALQDEWEGLSAERH